MIIVNKLYRKDFNQYNIEDWKYIFSIYALRDRYNFTEEEFLAAELVDKIDMMKKMDENLFVKGTIDVDSLHKNESVFAPCPQDEGCKVIQDFLEDENVKDHIHSPEDALKDFLEDLESVFINRLKPDSEEQLKYNAVVNSIADYKDYDEYKLKTSFKYKVLKFLKLTK